MYGPTDLLGAFQGLPHRAPFLFVSEVVEIVAGHSGRAAWHVDGSEDFLRGHFPDNPVVPGVLLGEALAQLSGLVAFSRGANKERAADARLARIDIKLPRAVVPPALIALEATLTRRLEALAMLDVRASVGGETVAVGSVVLAIVLSESRVETPGVAQ